MKIRIVWITVLVLMVGLIMPVLADGSSQMNQTCNDCLQPPATNFIATKPYSSLLQTEPENWDVAVRFDVANYGYIYPFSLQAGTVGETYYTKLEGSENIASWVPYCYTGCGWQNCYWANKARQRCVNLGIPCEKLDPEQTGCMCYQGVISGAKLNGWFVEKKKVSESKYYLLIRGVSKADCYYVDDGYVKGMLWLNEASGWRITKVNKCSYSVDDNSKAPRGQQKESYCLVNETAVRFAAGSSCYGCCACEDSGRIDINVTVEKETPYAITIHFHYPDGWRAGDPLPQKDVVMIQKAKDLNAHYVRFDIYWGEVEPKRDQFNEDAIAYFKAVVDEIKNQGMEPLVILGTDIPDWAIWLMLKPSFDLYLIKHDNFKKIIKVPKGEKLKILNILKDFSINEIENRKWITLLLPKDSEVEKIPIGKVEISKLMKFAKRNQIPLRNLKVKDGYVYVNMLVSDEFLNEAREYASRMASEYGGDVYYYQLGNEPNHDVFSLIYWLDGPKYIRALYEGVDSADNGFESAINFLAEPTALIKPWADAIERYLDEVGDCINIVGIDHYPGTWDNQNYDHWDELDVVFTLTEKYGKKAAVMETGFSTYEPIWHNEEKQREFINTALPAIRGKVNSLGKKLMFIAWYELIDEENPSVPLPQEYYFGILRADFSKKQGYNDLKQQFSEW